ncbi:MAG: OmpA family protein [Candidatus Omnitrophica bacterium]|nr:OmpA family protein [Candidatus Omnitrophota bacterium]
MRRFLSKFSLMCMVALLSFSVAGCTVVFQKGRSSDIQKISSLKRELTNIERAKRELENKLRNEIDDRQVSVEMLERGLVITFVSEVLFDSGKANLRSDSLGKLDKVASVLMTTVKDLNVGVEGYTDNVPIKYSGWKSNWELSSARAMNVLHYLVDNEGVSPERLSATGYGEFRPIASNETKEGRQANRRVEIVILPNTIKEKSSVKVIEENLK